jgi:hypothetical protein
MSFQDFEMLVFLFISLFLHRQLSPASEKGESETWI